LATRHNLFRSAAFTLAELIVVLGIIAVLTILVLLASENMRGRAQRVQCMANLRSLYAATELYIQQNGSWPQIASDESDESDQALASAWIAALKPFGPTEKNWICPTIENLMQNPDYTSADNVRIDYIPTPFDDKPTTPHQWPKQPWFIEVADVHGHGNLIIFTDGSISDLKSVLSK
jgi:type II secretory pathway pseudopilin PulG